MKVNLLSKVTRTALISVLSLFCIIGNSASEEERLLRLEQMAESRGQLQADIMFQLNAIQQELQLLRGKMEEHDYQLKQLQERQRDLYRDIEHRLSKIQGGQSASSSPSSGASGGSETPKSGTNSAPDVHSDYQEIFELVRNKQYDQAVSSYLGFQKKYPGNPYEANVHYWLGQIYYLQQKLDLALIEYQNVTSRFADSARAADSLYKQGKILVLQNKFDEAKTILNQVVDNYDGTTEQLAKKELQTLKSQGK